MEELPLPSTSQEAEALVLALYEPSAPRNLKQIQETLSRLQRSPSGWWIARDLLSSGDDKVKFYGALTVTVKLNTERHVGDPVGSLSQDDSLELLHNLTQWIVRSLKDGSGIIVIRKLISALVTFFLHFPNQGRLLIRHLCVSLSSPQAQYPLCSIGTSVGIDAVLRKLELQQLRAALWLTGTLVEEAGKTDLNTSKHSELYEATLVNAHDAVSVMSYCFASGLESHDLYIDCIKCLQSWIWFSQRVSLPSREVIKPLRTLTERVFESLGSSDLFEIAGELVYDLLSNYPSFLVDSHYQLLFSLLNSQWGHERYQGLINGDFEFESVLFGQIILSLGEARAQELLEEVSEQSQWFLSKLCGLTAARGYPVADDRIFVPAIEFWSTFTETIIDKKFSDEAVQPWIAPATSHVLQVASNAWRKASFPPMEVFLSWDSSDRMAFGDARKDVADFLQSTYAVTGPQLVSTFADLVLQQLALEDWWGLEAAAFCLRSLADCVADDTCDGPLKLVFSSSLFDILQRPGGALPPRVRQTCLSLIERYSDYFERETASLPAVLNLLFSVLPDAALACPAARSIQRLCYSSRRILASEANAFLGQYNSLCAQSQVDCLASEKVIGGIACVLQAIADDRTRLEHLEVLLKFVQHDAAKSLLLIEHPELADSHKCLLSTDTLEISEHVALKALRCLASIGKGMRSPVEIPVDLDTEASLAYPDQTIFLTQIQADILGVVQQIQEHFPRSGEVVDCICDILRTGFSERETGPFVFPPEKVVGYLTRQNHPCPRLGLFVSAACSFMSALSNFPGAERVNLCGDLLCWVANLLQLLPEPETDPELAQNCIDFTNRLLVKYPAVFFRGESTTSVEILFVFALRVLEGREPLPKAAAAEFWASFVLISSNDPSVQALAEEALTQLGPSLAFSLIRGIGGNAARSELDKLCEPLKKLVSRHAKAQVWLSSALFDQSFPGYQLSQADKSVFLKKVISLRGSRATNQVVRDFWLASRGSKFAYTS
ncbi:hypothetical protein SODALDRAFT_311989 [Sodiomyces alkalinus F11]|uniref:ARM repeat-containing protein n=1 Tax=Sodiomyces alkalinus (strain CBS 110278 / VKM F-3762 / F11) TaxID=1314773 RepID=A0A3N2PWJ2_SODAK|nr:hypothetical protein SODALDRAFT_311989 [Sodiomyces alkalinus F11]ROT38867.1 hypothetical protein SODALDRAFT_311989 [Sodiomyces alkalinus F11]